MPGLTLAAIESNLRAHGRPLTAFRKGMRIRAARAGYSYVLETEPGDLDPSFQPDLAPQEMLMLGVFEGKYLNDCTAEFPAEWFVGAMAMGRLSPERPNAEECSYFGVKSRQPLSVWRDNGWAPSSGYRITEDRYRGMLGSMETNPDERGWFQWYCRYWMGRRIPELDQIQIARWRSFRRHAGAIKANCKRGDLSCRARERQALLQWAYDPFI
jgi:hypothetical protein